MPSVYLRELDASQLLFDEGETRAILQFFRPGLIPKINTVAPSTTRFASCPRPC
jgi:hypothetical protein